MYISDQLSSMGFDPHLQHPVRTPTYTDNKQIKNGETTLFNELNALQNFTTFSFAKHLQRIKSIKIWIKRKKYKIYQNIITI